jgi:hypothetical protein
VADPQFPNAPEIPALINLDTFTLPLTMVTIDGTPYPVRPKDLLSISEQKRATHYDERFRALFDKPGLATPEEEIEMAYCLDVITKIVLEAPAALHAQLNDYQRRVVIDLFLHLPIQTLRVLGAVVTAMEGVSGLLEGAPTIGEKSSRNSFATTAATP